MEIEKQKNQQEDKQELQEQYEKQDSNIIQKIIDFVEQECSKPSSTYGYEPFLFHFTPVHKYAKMLAEKLGADVEVVELAAWLHDIGSIMYGRIDHHITGAQIAEKKLKSLGYPKDKIEKVKSCILTHRGSLEIPRETPEAKIIAEADAMSHFDCIGGMFKAAFIYEDHTQKSAEKSIRQKLINSWNKLSDEAKKIIKPKYDAAMVLLS